MAGAQPAEWIAGIVESPGNSLVVLWYEPETDLVVDIHVTEASLAEAPELFERVTEQPKAGPPRRPQRVRVADPALADALRGRIGDVDVVVGDISAAQEALVGLAEHMAGLDLGPTIAPAVWERLFRAAARLYRARPWNAIPADQWIGVECAQLDITSGALMVVGQAGESYGFILTRTLDDAVRWTEAGIARDRGESVPLPLCYMLGFDHRAELDTEELAEVMRLGWEVADPAAYPRVTVIEGDGEGRIPSADELAGVTAIVDAVAQLVVDEPDLADAWEGEPIEWATEVDGQRVGLFAPIELPATPRDPADRALLSRLAEQNLAEDMLEIAEMLVEFVAQTQGTSFAGIGPDEARALLLDTLPEQVAIDGSEAARILDAMRALVTLAAQDARNERAPAVLDMINERGFERTLAEALDDREKYGVGKQLVLEGIEAGFDMSTEQGVEDFVRAFAEEARRPARATAKKKSKVKTTAKTAVKAKARAKAKPKAKAAVKAKAKPASKAKGRPASKAKARKKR